MNDEPYGYKNQGVLADAIFYPSPLNLSFDSAFQGVLINQYPDEFDSSIPYYTIKAEQTQSISVHDESRDFYFQGWQFEAGATILNPDYLVGGFYQSPIVFHSECRFQ